jgi:hypothetical protein
MSENNKNTKTDKVFIDGLWIKQRTFENGGSVLKVSVLVDKFIDVLKKYKKSDGFVNLVISARREVKENGESHFATLDTFIPKVPTVASQPKKTVSKKSEPVAAAEESDSDTDI